MKPICIRRTYPAPELAPAPPLAPCSNSGTYPVERLRERSLDKAVRSECWEQDVNANAEGWGAQQASRTIDATVTSHKTFDEYC